MGVITEIERQKYFAYLDGVADGLNESRNDVNENTGIKLDEAIKRYENNAEFERTHGNLQGCLKFRQLAEWLKDYKRLKEQEPVLDKIRAEIDRQEKWLLQAGYTAYNADIAFDAIKSVLAESEVSNDTTTVNRDCRKVK